MLKLDSMIVDFRIDFTICLYIKIMIKDAMVKTLVIVKNRFLQEAFEIFGSVARKLFEVFDKMSLVKKIVFVTNFC